MAIACFNFSRTRSADPWGYWLVYYPLDQFSRCYRAVPNSNHDAGPNRGASIALPDHRALHFTPAAPHISAAYLNRCSALTCLNFDPSPNLSFNL